MTWARVYGSEDWHRVESESSTGLYVRATCGDLFVADARTREDPRSDPRYSTGWVFICAACRDEGKVEWDS